MESMSLMHVAPVVVNPLIVSKKALAISISLSIMKGIIPSAENTTHESATTRKLSDRVMWVSPRVSPTHLHRAPTPKQMRAVQQT